MRYACLDCGSLFLTVHVRGVLHIRCPACSLKYPKDPDPKPTKKRKASKRKKKD